MFEECYACSCMESRLELSVLDRCGSYDQSDSGSGRAELCQLWKVKRVDNCNLEHPCHERSIAVMYKMRREEKTCVVAGA